MPAPHWLWIVFTLIAVAAQTLRNALQRSLTRTIGTLGATEVRFVYGLPFAIAIGAAVLSWGGPPPLPRPAFYGWVLGGAVTQIVATGLLLAAMRERAFVVVIAYSKTEPVQVAIFGLVFLGDPLTAGIAVAVVAATIGVMLLSWPAAGAPRQHLMPIVQGVVSAAFFALSAVCFRGAIETLDGASYIIGATTTLVVSLSVQTLIMATYTYARDRRTLVALLTAGWPAIIAGLAAAFASQFWFLAFALESAARVRTLGVVEIVFAQAVSLRLFREHLGWRPLLGLALIAVAMVAVISG